MKVIEGNEHVSGIGAKAYVNQELLIKVSIGFWFIDYEPSRHLQIHSGFVENMSLIDTVFNIGCKSVAMKLKEKRVNQATIRRFYLGGTLWA